MTLFSIFLIASALSLDAAAVAAANGAHHHRMSLAKAIKIAFFFGVFHLLMPLVGWAVGIGFGKIIAKFDHWIAFVLLGVLGIKMVLESQKSVDEKTIDIHNIKILLLLSVAISIDALVVGAMFALLPVNIWYFAITIGLVAFIFSLAAIYIGKKFGEKWGKKSEIVGGLVLIAIGVKILVEHLFFK